MHDAEARWERPAPLRRGVPARDAAHVPPAASSAYPLRAGNAVRPLVDPGKLGELAFVGGIYHSHKSMAPPGHPATPS